MKVDEDVIRGVDEVWVLIVVRRIVLDEQWMTATTLTYRTINVSEGGSLLCALKRGRPATPRDSAATSLPTLPRSS